MTYNEQKAIIGSIHRRYLALVGYDEKDFPLDDNCWWAWEAFCQHFNEQDLEMLIRHIRRQPRPRSTKFRNLIAGDTSIAWAREDLIDARRLARAKYVETDKDKALKSTGRPTGEAQAQQQTTGGVAARVDTIAAHVTQSPEQIRAGWEKLRKETNL